MITGICAVDGLLLSVRHTQKPSINPDEVDGGSGDDMLQIGLGLADGAERHKPKARTPWEMVPSIPTRSAYSFSNSLVSSRHRAARKAWYSSSVGTVIDRRA